MSEAERKRRFERLVSSLSSDLYRFALWLCGQEALAKDLALHIASTAPMAVSQEEIAEDVVERERHVYLEQVKEEGKPEPRREHGGTARRPGCRPG